MKNIIQNKILIISVLLVIIAYVFFKFVYLKSFNEVPNDAINTDKNSGLVEDIKGSIEKPKIVPDTTDSPKYISYMTEALAYKSQGDAGDKSAYYKAIESYKKAIAETDNNVWLPYLNIGNVYKLLRDYPNAEKAYDEGLKIASDAMLYIAKIELYQSFIKKPFEDVKNLYEQALATTVENATITINYASFLKENAHYAEALNLYKILSKSYPNNQGYKDQIASLEAKL